MPARKWSFLNNPFENASDGSFLIAKKLGEFTLEAITTRLPPPSFVGGPNPLDVFTQVKNMLQPLMVDYNAKYNAWINLLSSRKSSVSELTDKLALLRGVKIKKWDVGIQNIYEQDSPGYIKLLPNRRAPFQVNNKEKLMVEVDAFRERINAETGLPTALKTEIIGFCDDLKTNYTATNAEKSKTITASDNLDNARIQLCRGLYSALGSLMALYPDDTDQIEAFFDMQSVRSHEQTKFRHKVKAGTTYEVMKHGFKAEDEVRLINDGDAPLTFYLAATPTTEPGTTKVTVPSGEEKKVATSLLGNIENHYLMVANEYVVDGHYMVVLP